MVGPMCVYVGYAKPHIAGSNAVYAGSRSHAMLILNAVE